MFDDGDGDGGGGGGQNRTKQQATPASGIRHAGSFGTAARIGELAINRGQQVSRTAVAGSTALRMGRSFGRSRFQATVRLRLPPSGGGTLMIRDRRNGEDLRSGGKVG